MVLSCVQLLNDTGNPRFIAPDHHENILGVILQAHEIKDNFHMGHALDSSTYFVLTLHDQYAIRFQNTPCLNSCSHVEFKHCVMPFVAKFRWPIAV